MRLALAYRLTLRILFRLLFQAYAEDTRLLPLHRNERYTRESLKELARDLDVPVLACSQLSRALEARPTHIPQLSDLRDSGSIEQE